MQRQTYAIAFVTESAQVLYYTGKAGAEFLSKDIKDAFFGYSLKGVEYVGGRLQKTTFMTATLFPVAKI